VKLGARGAVAEFLENWSRLWADAWQWIRVNHPEHRWGVSGRLYAVRRDLVPETVAVPLIEDMSLGSYFRSRSARFLHIADAVVEFAPPRTVRDWLRQKIRTRRGFVQLARFEPGVPRLQDDLLRAVKHVPGGRSFSARALVWQERLVRMLARIRPHTSGSGTGEWDPIPSTKWLA
jgi:hypothetical protein